MGQEESTFADARGPPETLQERSLEAVAEHIKSGDARRIVVLTGAGISTAAGSKSITPNPPHSVHIDAWLPHSSGLSIAKDGPVQQLGPFKTAIRRGRVRHCLLSQPSRAILCPRARIIPRKVSSDSFACLHCAPCPERAPSDAFYAEH